ncbi:hypothetical protein CAEBREN_02190 [Caenorhabditis brenneri]|uniref:Uncharacterized protein n=1 Tax=Caenorhabditis brenneri TaxID=135651 RepID=G0MYK3_CAEBE|nr:hypothetical protein CAEBREN_02190 [Caenorhabditis brenneri]
MFRSSLLLLFFLLLGSASAGALFVRNPDGTFTEKVDFGHGSSSKTIPADHPLVNYGTDAQPSLDDADLELIHEYFPDQKIKQNRNLRYSDLPLVEKSLKKDIFMIIAKNEDYMSFLNNPSHQNLFVMINDMIKGPNQQVLQDQIWNKILAIEAFYKKFVEPLNRPDFIEKVMKLLMRLEGASGAGELTVEDTVQLDQNLEKIAFLFNQNLTQRLLTMIENNLHPVPLEHKRSHHVRKSAISETSTGVPSSNQTENFVNVPPSSFGRMENITQNNGTRADVSKVKASEHPIAKDDSNVNKDQKSFADETQKFVSGNFEDDSISTTVLPIEDKFATSVVPARKNAASAVNHHPSILTETEMTEGKHPGQKTNSSSKTHLREFDTIVPPVRRTRGNSFS